MKIEFNIYVSVNLSIVLIEVRNVGYNQSPRRRTEC
jgi:hypothetical protein